MRVLACLLITISLVMVSCCFSKKEESSVIQGTGTIVYLETEGGFYGLIADDGTNYDPVNLSPEFRKDSLRVKFTALPKPDAASFHMWGVLVELQEIKVLD